MISKNLKYNEIEYAKLIEEKGFQSQYYKYELKILAKYWKFIGIKPKQRKEKLYEFCEKHIKDFDRVIYFKLINSTIADSNKKTSIPIVIKSVELFEHEIDFLNSLPVEVHFKKILLTILIEKKIHKKYFEIINPEEDVNQNLSVYLKGTNTYFKNLKDISKIPTKIKILEAIHELHRINQVTILKRGLIKLNFVEELNKQTSDKSIDIISFDEVGYYFDLLNGDKKISSCCDCERLIKKKSNRQVRCIECSKIHWNSYVNERQKENRKSLCLETP